MTTKNKTHYRKVFKSDHLGVADLEDFIESGRSLVFTVSHVNQEFGVMVAGRKGNHNIAYFKEGIKPLVLNATNSKTMKNFANGSSFVEDWSNIPIQLYIDPKVKMKGDVVGGVRISKEAPRVRKELLPKDTAAWSRAIEAFNRDGNLNTVKKYMDISKANESKLIAEAKKNVA